MSGQMKELFEEWGCLVLIAAMLAFFYFANSDSKTEASKKADPAPPVYVSPAPTFGGYACTDDCSGHEAGYEWAEEQGISDPDECGGDSISFEEGCRAYAEEQGDYEDQDELEY